MRDRGKPAHVIAILHKTHNVFLAIMRIYKYYNLLYYNYNSRRHTKGGYDMKKTNYIMVVVNMSGANITRRVFVDISGNYFIKINGEVRNVTHLKNDFIRG